MSDDAAGPPGTAAEAPPGPWRFLAPPAPADLPRGSPPAFSVVVAAYQAAATLPAALESALVQTYPAIEIIVCDDGSTDATPAVLKGYGASITTIRQANAGEAAAKNTAVRAARGDYVVVLDADDVFLPSRLEALAWLATRRPDLDILTTDAVVEADGVPVRRAYHAGWPFPARDQRAAIVDHNFVFGLCAVRRDRWLSVGGFDEGLAHTADWDFWLRLILSGSRVGLVDEPLARYRLAANSLSADRARLVRARLEVLSRAAARDDLTARERAIVASAIRRERRDLASRLAAASLDQGGWPARRRFAAVALGRGVRMRTRFGAVLAVASPSLAARRRERRLGGTIEIGGGLQVRRDPGGGDRPAG